MPVATEIAIFDLLPGVDLRQRDSDAWRHFDVVLGILKEQKGVIEIFWGLKDEDATKLVVLVDWEDVTDHQSFANTDAFKILTTGFAGFVSFEPAPQMTHAHFTSDGIAARHAPVTAFKSFMLPQDANEEQKAALEDAFLRLARFNMANTPCLGYTCGWSLELLSHEGAPSTQAVVFNVLIGWPERKDFQELRHVAGFKDALQPVLAAALKLREQDMFHLSLHREKGCGRLS